jgi:hypothetical protein
MTQIFKNFKNQNGDKLPQNVLQKMDEVMANPQNLSPEQDAKANRIIGEVMMAVGATLPVPGAIATVADAVNSVTGNANTDPPGPGADPNSVTGGTRKKGGAEQQNPLLQDAQYKVSFPPGPLGIDIRMSKTRGIVVTTSTGNALDQGVEVGDVLVRVDTVELGPRLKDVPNEKKCLEVKKIIETLPRPLEVWFEKGEAQEAKISGDEAKVIGEEAKISGDEAKAIGEEAKISGEDAKVSEEEKIILSKLGNVYLAYMLCMLESLFVLPADFLGGMGVVYPTVALSCMFHKYFKRKALQKELKEVRNKTAGSTRKRRRRIRQPPLSN